MNKKDISKARNPLLRGSYPAMIRAAQEARRIAIETNTALIRVVDRKTVRVTADELRKEIEAEK